jgi:hypothetical protein
MSELMGVATTITTTAAEARAKSIENSRQKVINMFNANLQQSILAGKTSFYLAPRDLNVVNGSTVLNELATKFGYSFSDHGGSYTISW